MKSIYAAGTNHHPSAGLREGDGQCPSQTRGRSSNNGDLTVAAKSGDAH
jgi:hypothetical protein